MRYECSTVLASALLLLLRFTAHAEPDFIHQYRDVFLLAAQALEKLSCYTKVNSKTSESLAVVSVLARATYGSILVACMDVDDEQEHSFVFNCMTKKFLLSLLALVTNLDESVSLLLQTLALQPFGSEIFISSGVCSAARAYLVEEERVSA
jgi:hypothetical protein